MKFFNKVYNFFEGFNVSINGYNFCLEKKIEVVRLFMFFLKIECESYFV